MQIALAGFIDDGLFDKHLRRSRRVYAERHYMLTQALSGPLARYLTALPSHAGLHIAAILRDGLSENEAVAAAARHGIATVGMTDYYHTLPARHGFLLGFGAVSTTDLPAALRTLGTALAP